MTNEPLAEQATDAMAGVRCERTRGSRALLLALSPAFLVLFPFRAAAELLPVPPWTVGLGFASALFAAGLAYREGRHVARLVGVVAIVGFAVLRLVERQDAPLDGFVVMVAGVAALAYIFPNDRLRRAALASDETRHSDVRVANAVAVFTGLTAWMDATPLGLGTSLALAATFLLPVVLAFARLESGAIGPRVGLVLAGAFATAPALALLVPRMQAVAEPVGLLAPLVTAAVRMPRRLLGAQFAAEEPSLVDVVLAHPPRALVGSFALLCLGGTVLLALPLASATGESVGVLDAAFTAVSATCVTGLIVLDTPVAFSSIGQGFVLLLIQVGGLGIMVFSSAAAVLLGRRLSIGHEASVVDAVGAAGRSDMALALWRALLVTFVTELITAVGLAIAFVRLGDPLADAVERAVFTSVSAFCNAGFALQSDSLVPYARNPAVLALVGFAIFIGGLGPHVVAWLPRLRRRERMPLHVRLVLATSLILTIVPALIIGIVESGRTMAGMSFVDQASNALFQSVTLRTAGFNSIDLARIHPATWTTMVLMMFVGGSPGSTAGGAKTTTIAIVVLSVLAVVRGRDDVEVFGRRVPLRLVLRATAVTTVGVVAVALALVALQLTQDAIPLDSLLFEAVSALATVGLSTGATAQLDEVGKVVIMACMFAGRVGPLTFFVFLSRPPRSVPARRPEESLLVG